VPFVLTRLNVPGRGESAWPKEELETQKLAAGTGGRAEKDEALAGDGILEHLAGLSHASILRRFGPRRKPEYARPPGMRIAIAGAGIAGSYIYRLLRLRGHNQVDVFDVRHRIACGIHPCGYGVDHNFDALVRRAGLDPSRYVIHQPAGRGYLEGVAVRTTVFMIDKPRFIRDLLDGADVAYEPVDPGRYDLVVDATGEARAYAPPLRDDLKARVIQWRVRTKKPASLAFRPTRGIPGYAWGMPLSADGTDTHVGGGCRAGVRRSSRSLTQPAFEGLDVERVICACGAFIRLSGPDFESIVHENVWAVGEAAGLVGPVTGAGNVYAMLSGLHLVDHLGDPDGYVAALRRDFSGLVPEARAVRRILAGRLPTPVDLVHVRAGWARGGVYVPWRRMPQVLLLMERAFLFGAAGSRSPAHA